MERANCDEDDIQKLAAYLCGLDPETATTDEVEEALQTSMFEMDESCLSTFHSIIEKLIPLIEIGDNPLRDTVYKGFARREKYGQRVWLTKDEISIDDDIQYGSDLDSNEDAESDEENESDDV